MRPLLMTANACVSHMLGSENRHMIRHASPPHLTLDMSTVSAQCARQRCFQMYVPQFEPRPTCRVHRHVQSRRLEYKKHKNRFQLFVSACPPQAETKCLETGSVHIDVYSRLAVLSHRCHKQRWWMGTVLGTEMSCFAPTGLVCKCRAQAGLLRTRHL